MLLGTQPIVLAVTPHDLCIPVIQVVADGDGKESTRASLLCIATVGGRPKRSGSYMWM